MFQNPGGLSALLAPLADANGRSLYEYLNACAILDLQIAAFNALFIVKNTRCSLLHEFL